MRKVIYPFALFIFAFLVSTSFSVGGMNSLDGTNFGLLRAIVESGTVKLNDYKRYTYHTDYSINPNGDWVADREPGLSLMAVPFFVFGKRVQNLVKLPYQGLDVYQDYLNQETKLQILTYSSISFYVAAVLSLSYVLLKRLGYDSNLIIFFLFNIFLGTLLLKYSSSYSRHAVVAVNNLVVVLCLWLFNKTKNKKYILLVGIFLGFSAIVDYLSWIGSFLIFMVFFLKEKSFKLNLIFLKGFLPFLMIAFVYNLAVFAKPIVSPHAYEGKFVYMREFSNNFRTPLFIGMRLNLFSNGPVPEVAMPWLMEREDVCHLVGCKWARVFDYKGIFIQSPILAASLFGFYFLFKKRNDFDKWLVAYAAVIFLSFFIPMSKLTQFWSPNIYDGRHLLAVVPMLMLGLLGFRDKISKKGAGTLLIAGLFMLSLISMKNSLISAMSGFAPNLGGERRYTVDQLDKDFSQKMFKTALINVFPNWSNLPLMFVWGTLFFLPPAWLLGYLDDESKSCVSS